MNKTVQYLLLTIILICLLITAFLIPGRWQKSLVVLLISIVYFGFGLLHHLEEKTFEAKVVWEYLALSVLTFVVLFSLLVGRV